MLALLFSPARSHARAKRPRTARRSTTDIARQAKEAEQLLDTGKATAARLLLQKALGDAPEDPRLHYLRARAEVRVGSMDKARQALIFALRYGGPSLADRATAENDLQPLRRKAGFEALLAARGLSPTAAKRVRAALKKGSAAKGASDAPQLTDIDEDGRKEAFLYQPAHGQDGARDLLGVTLGKKGLLVTRVARVPGDVDHRRVGVGLTYGKLAIVSWYASEGEKSDAHAFALRVRAGRVEVVKHWDLRLEGPCRERRCRGKAQRVQITLWLADVLGDERAEAIMMRHVCGARGVHTTVYSFSGKGFIQIHPRILHRALAVRRKKALAGDAELSRWLLALFPADTGVRLQLLLALAKRSTVEDVNAAIEDQLLEAHRYTDKRAWSKLLKALSKKAPKLVKLAKTLLKEESEPCYDSYQEKLLASPAGK